MDRRTVFISVAGFPTTFYRLSARTIESRLRAPIERTFTLVVRPHAGRATRAFLSSLAVLIGSFGALAVALGSIGFPVVKRWADHLASDGSLERMTPELYAHLVPWAWGVGSGLLLLAIALFVQRAPLQRQLLKTAADALVSEPDSQASEQASGQASERMHRLELVASAGTALTFWGLYLSLGVALWSTGVFDHFDGLFSADPPRIIRDLAQVGADGGRSHLHPLFILFFNPIGVLVSRWLGWRALTAVIMSSFAGAVSVFLGQLFFHSIGMPTRLAILWSILVGFTTSHLVFSAVPETCIFTAPPTILCCILAHRRSRFLPFVGASLAAFAITSTNLIVAALLYLFSLRRSFAAGVFRAAGLGLCVLTAGAGLALVQKDLFPKTKLFFSPTPYRSAVFDFVPDLHQWSNVRSRADDLARHMFVYTVMAPVPYIKQTGLHLGTGKTPTHGFVCPQVCAEARLADSRQRAPDSHPAEITFESSGPVLMHAVGQVGVLVWLGILLCAVYEGARQPRRSGVLTGMVAGLAFQFVLHLVYGDDLFLYSPHWAFLLVGGVALALRHHWQRAWLTAAIGVLLVMQVLNNGTVIYAVWALLSHQHL